MGNNVNERLKNGFRIVIAGEANAGKSSLINTLTQRNAVIVSDIAGTTRDAIDINLDISGYPVVITDTAGIRETDNPIEKQGIEIALQKFLMQILFWHYMTETVYLKTKTYYRWIKLFL